VIFTRSRSQAAATSRGDNGCWNASRMVLLSGDLVIAMALALWLAVGTPSRRIEVGALDNYC
jgi:hypothetical protein